MFVLSIISIIISSMYLLTVTRDMFIIKLMSKTHSDTLAKVIYFGRLSDPAFYFTLGNYYFGEGPTYDLEKARKYFQKTLELNEQFERGNYQMSRVFFIEGNQSTALSYIDKELVYYPDFGRSYYIRGLVNGYSGNLGAAVTDFKNFLVWKPNSWAGHNDLAWIYFQQGDFQNAYETSVAGLEFSPGNPWLLNSVGVSLKNMGDLDGAEKAFEAAKYQVGHLTEVEWGKAYPGNDPDFYQKGFSNMKQTIDNNISLIKEERKVK